MDKLPSDVLVFILLKLPMLQILRNIRVCKIWKQVIVEKLVKFNAVNLHCTKITDAGLVHLSHVHTIDLYNTNVTDAGMVHLSHVHTVNLSCTKITDAGLVHLSRVHTVNLSYTKITDACRKRLQLLGVNVIAELV